MATMAKIKKMSTQSIARMQKMVEDEMKRRNERMEQLAEVRDQITSAVKAFGLAAEEVLDMFKSRRGRPPSKKTATGTTGVKRKRGRPASKKTLAKRAAAAQSGAAKVAKKATKRVAKKTTGAESKRSIAMKKAWARRKAAAAEEKSA